MYAGAPKEQFFILLFFRLISCSSAVDDFRSNKLSECGRCKVLTNSFIYWLDKTSRGKFEGGDAAWEEAKLKSYARSEIRLVEVQEGLCSELSKDKDTCFMLAEEVEQLLEKWWFHEDANSADIYTWLCIDTLKYCCPAHHFGDTCMPCAVDKLNNICNGNGQCDGDGTRSGNGSCICKRGYSGKYCEDCSENFYPKSDKSCQACHQACKGCSGEGASACFTCRPGWQLKDDVCTDIDECLITNPCRDNQFCINKEGTFKCKLCDNSCKTCLGIGPSNCTSCASDKVLWTGMCINESDMTDYSNILIRLVLYLGLLVISLILFRIFKKHLL